MHSFLIVSRDKKKASLYISDFLKKKGIYPIDISQPVYEKAVGIEDVRNIQKSILFKPFKGKSKAIVIEAYEGITTEAQNALLKILEEPPINTIIVVSIPKKELLLPTIISRCKIIELQGNDLALSREENIQYLNILVSLSENGIGYKLKLAQDITKNKDEVILWLEKMSIFVRTKLIENYNNPNYLNFLRQLQKTYTIIKSTNVNQRIALENLFLSF